MCSLAILVRCTIHLYKPHTRNVCVCVCYIPLESGVWGGGVDMCEGELGGKIMVNYALHLFDLFS